MGKFSTLLRATGLAVTVAMPVKAQESDTVMATVNGTDITLGHMIALKKRLPDQYQQLEDSVLFEGILEQLIQQTALAQEIEKDTTRSIELARENEMRAFMAGEMLAKVGTADISEEEIQAAYDKQFENFEPEPEFNASHILVETEEEAAALKEEIEGGADFAEVAKEKSSGPSGPEGGSLGWFGKGQMVPEFEAAVIALEEGQISDPVQTQFGWHLVKLNESRPTNAPELEAVRDEIERTLRSEAVEQAITDITESAEVTRAEVEIDPATIQNEDLIEN
ncbi:peptidylprolyl isomerase [Litoreibacter roseus]|uniref:Parvulin-like PPIase n=1 Tax=Litoreibacter roseus TaxID=2601869 RepID=A0A6N6JFD5_9RHOB|nr:peptidylprolyl isomerase [Litoreibacter roseus]GFE64500.1 peptidylprolyl isomerase [Litoreibacter roseus]